MFPFFLFISLPPCRGEENERGEVQGYMTTHALQHPSPETTWLTPARLFSVPSQTNQLNKPPWTHIGGRRAHVTAGS